MNEEYNNFEITFIMLETGLTIKINSYIIFPKCKGLSLLKKNSNNFLIVNNPIDRQYLEMFLNLLYGNEIIRTFANDSKYSQIKKINECFINNLDKIY